MNLTYARTLFVIAILILASFFFFSYSSLYSQRSRADSNAPFVQAGFNIQQLKATPGQPAALDIFLQSDAKISAATVSIKYPVQFFEYVPPADPEAVGETCAPTFKLKTLVNVDNNRNDGILTVTRVTIRPHEELPSGNFCFGTITFRLKEILPSANTAWFTLNKDVGIWQITGSQPGQSPVAYNIIIPEDKSKLEVSFSGGCNLRSEGDANCDGIIDLHDFEGWRKGSKDADFDTDGKHTIFDFEHWRQGFYKHFRTIITPVVTFFPRPSAIPTGIPTAGPSPTCIPRPVCLDRSPYCYTLMSEDRFCLKIE